MIKRLQAFAEAGADCLYAPGPSTKDQISAVVKAVAPKPVNVWIARKTELTVPVLADLGIRRVSLNGEQVTVNLDDGTMHSWTFGSNLTVHVTDTHLFFETALTLRNIWQNLFEPNSVWQGFINRVDGTLKAHKRDGTVITGHCRRGPASG